MLNNTMTRTNSNQENTLNQKDKIRTKFLNWSNAKTKMRNKMFVLKNNFYKLMKFMKFHIWSM